MSNRKSFRKSISDIFKGPEDTHNWGPLLITIGPNCCGKTTFIKSLDEDVTEIVTENTPELHVKVSAEIAAKVWQDKISGDVVQTLRGQTVYNVPMLERLKKMRGLELTLVALLFAKLIPLKEFEEKMTPQLEEADYGDIFLSCVRELYHTKGVALKTKTIDIFIGEAVDSATASTAAALKAAIKTNEGVICWGNTNLNPDFYKDALKVADKYQRVVRFVRWGKELPIVPLRELFKRNILRFLETGRYVSSVKLDKFRKHADFFIGKATNNSHIEYASLAEYDMDDMGCVSHKQNPVTRKPAGRVAQNKYAVWTNTGVVYNIAQGPPVSPKTSPRGTSGGVGFNRGNSQGGSSQNSSDNDIEVAGGAGGKPPGSPRAASATGKKTPSVAGSNASGVGISFSATATKNVQKVPSDPNLLPLTGSNLEAAAAAAAAASTSDEKVTESHQPSELSSQVDDGIAFHSSKQQSVEGSTSSPTPAAADVKHQQQHPPKLQEPTAPSSTDAVASASLSSPAPAAATPASVTSNSKPPTAPPTPSRDKSANFFSSPSRQASAEAHATSGFSLLGLLGIKQTSARGSPSTVDSGAAKFVLDDSTPTTEPHPHFADHSVHLQDSVKLTHIHQREASQHLNKEKSVGFTAAELKKSASQGGDATASALGVDLPRREPSIHFADEDDVVSPAVETALSPAVFVVDEETPRPEVIARVPSRHEVHLQDSVKLAHVHLEEERLHPHPDEGPVGHPKDHQKHPIFIEPKRETSSGSTDEDEIGFTSSKSATFVLDDHSPRLTHQKSENGEVLLQDSVKLTHIHMATVHDKPLFNPVVVRNDSFDLKEEQKSAEKKINRTRSSSPPTRKLSFKASLVEEIPTEGGDTPTTSTTAATESSGARVTPRSAAASLFANVEAATTPIAPQSPANFVLDDAPPSVHPHPHEPNKKHVVHLQDSVKLTHLHQDQQQHSDHGHAPIHVVKIELTPEQNALQEDKHITFDNHSPMVVLRSPDGSVASSQNNSPKPDGKPGSGKGGFIPASSGKVGIALVESSEEEDGEVVPTLSTPKKEADPNAFACVFPNIFCSK